MGEGEREMDGGIWVDLRNCLVWLWEAMGVHVAFLGQGYSENRLGHFTYRFIVKSKKCSAI